MRMVNPILKLIETGRYEVTYLFQYGSDKQIQRTKAFFAPYPQVNVVGVQNQNKLSARERDFRLEMPLEVFNTMGLTYYLELERLLRTGQFDLVQVEHSWMSWVVPLIRKVAPGLPVVLDLHNIEATIFQRWIQYGPSDEREEMILRWERVRRWEEETWQWHDACLAVSPPEMQAYQKQTGHHIPTWELPTGGGVDLSRYPQTVRAQDRQKKTVLSLGTMAWDANTHGLLWFIDHVMPLLRQTHPHVRLYIAGFGIPSSKLLERTKSRKDIVLLGQLEDERPVLRQCQVFIVPLWIGAGARVKILTAWAAGIPVVATTIGAEGLSYTDGENILIADEPQEFAQKIARLMEDEALAQRLSRNCRALVEERYSLEYAAREYDRIYSSIVEKGVLSRTSEYAGHNFEEKERAIRQLLQLKETYEDALLAIQQSLVWRMLAKYLEVVNKLLPYRTRRRNAYELFWKGVRTIVNEGWRSFFRKAMGLLKSKMTKGESLRNLFTPRLPLAVLFGSSSNRLCPCCGCGGVTFQTRVMQIQRSYFGCRHCRYFRTDPIPSMAELSEYYNTVYNYSTFDRTEEEIALRAQDILRWLQRSGRRKLPQRVLEIGPAGGGVIAGLAKMGCEVIGIDISESVRDNLADRFGIKVLVSGDPVNAMISLADNTFDLIVVNHTLEHLVDPFATLATISRLLTEDGYCFIKVPNAFGLEALLHGNKWIWLDPIGHIHNWSPKSMRKTVTRAGLEPILDATLQGRSLLPNISDKRGLRNRIALTLCSPKWLDSLVRRTRLGCNYLLIVKRGNKLDDNY